MPFLGGVGMPDLERLDAVISGLGFFSKVILPILKFERRLVERKVRVPKKTSPHPAPVE